jgi:hypothetical protein
MFRLGESTVALFATARQYLTGVYSCDRHTIQNLKQPRRKEDSKLGTRSHFLLAATIRSNNLGKKE